MRLSVMTLGAAFALMGAGSASADCGNGLYCQSDMHSYEGGAQASATHASSHASGLAGGTYLASDMAGVPYSPEMAYSSGSYDMGTTTVSGGSYASHNSSSGAIGISESYTLDTDVSHTGTISNLSVPGLGANEKLCPVDCAQPAFGGAGKVLACYAVCQPAPQPVTSTLLTRVVHPVYYVRYPVPYAVPVPVVHPLAGRFGGVKSSRYGDVGYNYGYAHRGYAHQGYAQRGYAHAGHYAPGHVCR